MPAYMYVDHSSRLFTISHDLNIAAAAGDSDTVKSTVIRHLLSDGFLRLDPGHQIGILQDIAGQTSSFSIDYSDTSLAQGLQDTINELQQLLSQ